MIHPQQMTDVVRLLNDRTTMNSAAEAIAFVLAVVINRAAGTCFIEFPSTEPMVNVVAAIQQAEREHKVAFDLMDPDLWEYPEGGTRIHGMFMEDLRREENAYGIGSRKRTQCA